jgi:hypothetical protein
MIYLHLQALPDPEGFGKQKAEPERATDTEGEGILAQTPLASTVNGTDPGEPRDPSRAISQPSEGETSGR